MHPQFKRLVTAARSFNLKIIDRCNLTILTEPDYADMTKFLADQGVEIVASLPCYSATNVHHSFKFLYCATVDELQMIFSNISLNFKKL